MKEFRYTHKSGADGLELAVLRLEPDNPEQIKGIVQILHGMNDHKERYREFMEYLVERGFITIIHDHRGHGQSIKDPDDLGYMYKGGYKALVTDAHEITMEVKKYAKELTGRSNLPVTLVGYSMGSLVARCYLRKYDYEIQKLCVIGCPSERPGLKSGLMFIHAMEKRKGDHAREDVVLGLAMGQYENRFKKEEVPHAWVNSDPERVKEYNADPLCNYCFTLNGFENLTKIQMLTYRKGGHIMKNPDMPIRFYSGADDPCGISVKGIWSAMEFLKSQGYTDVRGRLYPGMRHEIFKEPGNEKVFKEITKFIEG